METKRKLNKMLIINLASLAIGGYFSADYFSGTWVSPIIITTFLSLAVFGMGLWVYNSFINKGKVNQSALNTIKVGSLAFGAIGVLTRLVALGGLVTYAPNGAGAILFDQTGQAAAILLAIVTGVTLISTLLSIKGKIRFEGYKYRYTRNLSIGFLAAFILFTVQAHFAPGVFGLVNTTTGWTGLVGGWAAHLLTALMYITVLGGFILYGFFMIKKPEFTQAGERPAFVVTAVTLIGVMMTIYLLDKYVITKMYEGISALDFEVIKLMGLSGADAALVIPAVGIIIDNSASDLEKLRALDTLINSGIDYSELGGDTIIAPAGLAYNTSMFALSTFAGIGIVNAPVIYWQKKVLHAH